MKVKKHWKQPARRREYQEDLDWLRSRMNARADAWIQEQIAKTQARIDKIDRQNRRRHALRI